MWNKPWFLSQGPVLGASCHRKMLTTDASLTGWGAILEGCSSQGLWKDHHLSWHINHLEMLAVFLALKNFLADLSGPPCTRPLIQHIGGLLHKSPGDLRSHPLCKLPYQILLWSQGKLLSLRAQYRSRHPAEAGAEPRGMEAPPRGDGADMEGVRPGTSGSVCISRDISLSTLVLPHAFQLLLDWTRWCRRGRGFVCMHFPRSLCSRES